MTSIFCFVPAYKNQLTGTTLLTTHALSKLLHSKGINFGISSISNPDVEWVRNFAITYWYDKQREYSHILFIDDDMGFMPDVVVDMIAFGEPVVGAIYPKKSINRQWAVSGLPNPEVRGPFVEVEGLGFGCFLIRRDAIQLMLEKMPDLSDYRPNGIDNDLFRKEGLTRLIQACQCIQDSERGKVSEDISFCRKWRSIGGRVWAAAHHKMVHVGPYEYADTYNEWAIKEQKRLVEERQRRIDDAPILKENPILKGKACKHGLFIYNPNDTHIGRSLEAYGEWCEFEIDFLSKFIKQGDTVIDVGANIGTHTAAFSKIVGKEGKVFAFEAQPSIEHILDANVKLNNFGNVIFANRVIGDGLKDKAYVPLLLESEEFNFGSFSLKDKSNGYYSSGLEVESISIDSFAHEIFPTLIKIDVEGMETDVLRGCLLTIKRCKPVLYFEQHDALNEEVEGLLKEIAYKAYWSIGPYFNPLNAFRNQINIWPSTLMPSVNLIAVSENKTYEPISGLQPFLGKDDTWRKAVERMAQAAA